MTTIFRYIAREVMSIFIVVFILLILMGLVGRSVGFLQDAVSGRYAFEMVWLLIAFKIPEFVQIIGPLALFIALVITYGRLHAESEYIILSVGGISSGRMTCWLLAILVPFAICFAYVSFQVTPMSGKAFIELSLAQRVNSEFDALTDGRFRTFSNGNRATYADRVDRETNHLSGVFIGEIVEDKVISLWAKEADYYRDSATGSRFLLLEDGYRYEGIPGQKSYRVLSFENLGQRIEVESMPKVGNSTEIRSTGSLSLQDGREAAELHWRTSTPLLIIISGLIAFGFAKVPPRSGRFGRLVPSMAIFLIYYVLLLLLRNFIPKNEFFFVIGMWPVHILMLVVAISLIQRQSKPA